MFFRSLNWNVVGWFRTVSLISYSIIAAGALDGLPLVATARRCGSASRSPAAPTSR